MNWSGDIWRNDVTWYACCVCIGGSMCGVGDGGGEDTTTVSDQIVRGFCVCGWEGCKYGDMLVLWMERTLWYTIYGPAGLVPEGGGGGGGGGYRVGRRLSDWHLDWCQMEVVSNRWKRRSAIRSTVYTTTTTHAIDFCQIIVHIVHIYIIISVSQQTYPGYLAVTTVKSILSHWTYPTRWTRVILKHKGKSFITPLCNYSSLGRMGTAMIKFKCTHLQDTFCIWFKIASL